ncbi:MAG: phosphotransferase family protein [Chloroflexota bacterium]|nr:phosphotransferase family protein [Chloroflexota bacterium]
MRPRDASGDSAAPIEPARLAAYLASVPALRDSLPVDEIERIGGGQSNLTFRVSLADRTVVLRRPPLGPLPPSAHDVLREFRVMQALAGSEVPVPALIAACSDPSILGAPFFLMEDLPADAIRGELPSALDTRAGRRAIGEQVVDTLAALHGTEPAAVGLADLGKSAGYLARQLRRWRGQLDYARVRPVPDLDWVSDWLDCTLPGDVERPSIVHGDYKLDNSLFSRELPVRLLAVVDWEMATLGDPLADLGWLLAFWSEGGTPPPSLAILSRVTEQSGFLTRAQLAERYSERVGRSLPDLRFYHVLALWKMAVLLEGHWARHVRGTAGTFDFNYLKDGGPLLQSYVRQVAEER